MTCSVGNGTADWKSKVAMTMTVTTMTRVGRMRILLVMTTSVIVLPHVFAGDVSVSRHFKGDIFSQEGNSERERRNTKQSIFGGREGMKSHRGFDTGHRSIVSQSVHLELHQSFITHRTSK